MCGPQRPERHSTRAFPSLPLPKRLSNQASDEQHAVMDAFGGLCQQYDERHYWWELMEMLRKCILAGALVLFSSGGVTQVPLSFPALATAQFQ